MEQLGFDGVVGADWIGTRTVVNSTPNPNPSPVVTREGSNKGGSQTLPYTMFSLLGGELTEFIDVAREYLEGTLDGFGGCHVHACHFEGIHRIERTARTEELEVI